MADPADPVEPPASPEGSDGPAEPQPSAGSDGPAAAPSRRRGRRGRRRGDTRDPRRSRERALKILFQADVRGVDAREVLARIVDDPREWALLDDLDLDEAADLDPKLRADDAAADPDPLAHARDAARHRSLALDGFTRSLVEGVADHLEDLDELVQRYARRWTVARMPVIDRNVLRLGAYELAHETTSPAVVINEVIELAKRLSTEDSGRYVNGVLESVRKHLADERATSPEVDPVVPDTATPPPFEPSPEPVGDPDADGPADGDR